MSLDSVFVLDSQDVGYWSRLTRFECLILSSDCVPIVLVGCILISLQYVKLVANLLW